VNYWMPAFAGMTFALMTKDTNLAQAASSS
jgi:hypothetical protein